MKIPTILPFISVLIFSCTNINKVETITSYPWPKDIKPPVCIRKDHILEAHGDIRTDPYYWLNDYFKKGPDSNAVVDYLKQENTYMETMLSGTKDFQSALFQELKGRIQEKDESVPVLRRGYYYYTRTEEGRQYYKYCRRKGNMDAPEEVLLDADKMAEGHGYFALSGFSISPDNRMLAYGVDVVSRRQYTLQIKDLETGNILKDVVEDTQGDPVWAADNRTLFYTAKNPVTLLSEKIKRHILGDAESKDEVVYEEKDQSNYIGVGKSKSDNYIFIYSQATMSSEWRYIDAYKPLSSFQVFQPRRKDILYSVEHSGDQFLVVTNWDAKNFKLMGTPLEKTGAENWKDIIPHREDVLLEDVEVFASKWVVTERKNGLIQFRVRELSNGQEHYLDFGEPTYTASIGTNPEFGSTTLRYNYSSMTTPASVFDYDMNGKEKKLMKEQPVLGGFKKGEYVTERVYAVARDGVKVPISIVYKKGLARDGKAPLLLYAYGSYGLSTDAGFSSNRLSLLDRGFVYAIAHIRGGQEMGRQWYEDGKLQKKVNTFNDFVDCGRYLISEKFTSQGHLYAMGGSAGGLLMGAVVNQAPELWNGIIAAVPFVDVVTTMSDPSIPLTTNEYDEWGNPADSASYFYMKSYSPYDNVGKKEYPNMLVTTGLHDSQVQYFEPAKWVAKLRTMKTGNQILLLKTNMEAGHGGRSGRFDNLKDVALQYAFLLALERVVK